MLRIVKRALLLKTQCSWHGSNYTEPLKEIIDDATLAAETFRNIISEDK